MYHAPQAWAAPPALAVTGLTSGIHLLVAAATVAFLGLALLRLIPRRES